MRTVVFDLDGTLADTSADLLAAANACFAGLGLPPPLSSADVPTALRGGRAMLRLGFARLGVPWDEAAVSRAYPQLLAAYDAAIDTHTRLYPGAAEAVAALRSTGFATAICTNKPAALAEKLTRRLGIRDLFGALVGADTLAQRKPDPAPYHHAVSLAGGTSACSFLLGDTETDALTARAAEVPVALVGFGPEGDGVTRHAPDAILTHFDALPALALRLLP